MRSVRTLEAHTFNQFSEHEFRRLGRSSRLKSINRRDRSGRILSLTEDEALDSIRAGREVYADVML